MRDFLDQLGIYGDFVESEDGDKLTLDLLDAEEYGKVYSKLDRSKKLEVDDEASEITDVISSIQFVNDDYTLTLIANMLEDRYKLVCREN